MILDQCNGLPLGVEPDVVYEEKVHRLKKGDQIIFYTDGITEAHNPADEMFGTKRLDEVLEQCSLEAAALLDSFCNRWKRLLPGEQSSTIKH